MCMKEDTYQERLIKGDNYLCAGGVSFVIVLTVLAMFGCQHRIYRLDVPSKMALQNV